jgi:hypothetical protein
VVELLFSGKLSRERDSYAGSTVRGDGSGEYWPRFGEARGWVDGDNGGAR